MQTNAAKFHLTSVIRVVAFLGLLSGLTQPGSELVAQLQEDCPDGTLWEPYTMVCAEVRDMRDQFLPQAPVPTNVQFPPKTELVPGQSVTNSNVQSDMDDLPVPGSLSVGITYRELPTVNSGRLHTKMFVHPYGLQPDAALPRVLFTTATSHMHHGLEIVGSYSMKDVNRGQLGLFAWPCFPDYPCPDGDTSSGWQWLTPFANLPCNITHGVDQGGHAQKLLYYANHTDKLEEGEPPLWKSAAYLWNYCDAAWDLAWQHIYREKKVDCSVPGSHCAWWGPGIEIYGADPYPQIAELGYEDSLLYHDGVWSELRWPEAGFRHPGRYGPATPWQLFHLDANRGFGVGNWVDTNDAPLIEGQERLEVLEDESVTISPDSLTITDPDVDPNFHVAYEITLYGNDNYTHSDSLVTPTPDFAGQLTVPITASDGAANSPTFELRVDVMPVNDAPRITGQGSLETLERTPLTVTKQDLSVEDVDNPVSDLTIFMQDGTGYQRVDNTITPELGVVGELQAGVVISDGELDSEIFMATVLVTPDAVPPELTLLGSPNITLTVGDAYHDLGATAVDNLDGDITEQIITDNSVDTSRAGSYTVTYSVTDLAGNSASITRTVIVRTRPRSGGGGGSADPLLVVMLLLSTAGYSTCHRRLNCSRSTPRHACWWTKRSSALPEIR